MSVPVITGLFFNFAYVKMKRTKQTQFNSRHCRKSSPQMDNLVQNRNKMSGIQKVECFEYQTV